jgi:hypothetical protein
MDTNEHVTYRMPQNDVLILAGVEALFFGQNDQTVGPTHAYIRA